METSESQAVRAHYEVPDSLRLRVDDAEVLAYLPECEVAVRRVASAPDGLPRADVGGRAPLARVPENSIKFVVGVMLTAFGLFWSAEGAGAHWPGQDAALLVIIPAIAIYALVLVAVFRRPTTAAGQNSTPGRASA